MPGWYANNVHTTRMYCGGCVRPRVSRETLCWGCAGSQRPPIPVILIRAARIWRGTLKFSAKYEQQRPHTHGYTFGVRFALYIFTRSDIIRAACPEIYDVILIIITITNDFLLYYLVIDIEFP